MKLNKSPESTKETLRLGKKSDFWEIMKQGIKDSIKHLENEMNDDDFKDLPSDQYKLESELLKAKIKYLKHLLKLPDEIIADLDDPNMGGEEDEDPDPYDK